MSSGPKDDAVLDVTEEQIARTYAQGFLGVVGEGISAAVEELDAVEQEVFAANPRLLPTLGSAFLDHEQRCTMIDRILGGKVMPAVLNLLKVLSSHGRMGIVPSVFRQVRKLYNEGRNHADVVVRLSHSADDALLGQIEQTIREKTGIEPVLRVEVDPDLLGGLEVRIGDTVFDGTVRTSLAKAHRSILEKTVQAIENQPERFTLAT